MPPFKKYVKKLPRHLQQVVLDAVEDVLANTEIGECKKGDLEGIHVYKFSMGRQLTLMAPTELKTTLLCCIRQALMRISTGTSRNI